MVQKPVRGSVRHEIGDLDKITNSIGVGLARQVGCHIPMNHCMSNKPRHSICFLLLKKRVWMYCFPHTTFGRDVLTLACTSRCSHQQPRSRHREDQWHNKIPTKYPIWR